MIGMERQVFFVSDRTGITAETLGETLLTQFPGLDLRRTSLPFIDSREKAEAAAARIARSEREDGLAPLVFSTLTDPTAQRIIAASTRHVFDLFGTFGQPMEQALGQPSSHTAGRMHGIRDASSYEQRIDALHFSLDNDDGMRPRELGNADLVLVGVSRSGKTPTCLYLALRYHVRAGNYPLTEEDLTYGELPGALRACRDKLQGLTIQPERLNRIREERRPGSPYASLSRCRTEVSQAEALFRTHGIPVLDVSSMSIEEIAATLAQQRGLRRPV